MKLELALIDYGLKPWANDYAAHTELNGDDQECRARVAQVVRQLNIRVLGADLITVQLDYGRHGLEHSTIWRGYALERTYNWHNTLMYRTKYSWGCGCIETAHRRFLSSNSSVLPQSIRHLIQPMDRW